jgi:3D-(3,5/4)-trihydroxycyclohexane-1,2-dione acylhydrolase (decyclizing)
MSTQAATGFVRLTVAEALMGFLRAQHIETDAGSEPLFGCAFAIFGHGNVTCFSGELQAHQDELPLWRGQNEQSMALAAVAYAKAHQRRRIGVALASIGPGALNMVTAAGVAHTNRLPLLLLAGDAHVNRLPDPVLQQVEHFQDPSLSVNDAFKPVVRYWDRVVTPAQLLQTLPQAISTLLDPETCGPVFLGLPQDVQGQSFDFPATFFAKRVHRVPRPEPEARSIAELAQALKSSRKPLVIAGGGVHYAKATAELAAFAQAHGVPVVETIAGRAVLLQSHPQNAGPIGVTGSDSANQMAAEADLVLAIGTRLQDFSTGSWSVFRNPEMRLVSINVGRHDTAKHFALSVRADAGAALQALELQLQGWQADAAWGALCQTRAAAWKALVYTRTCAATGAVSYAQVVGAVNRGMQAGDTVVTAAGGLPAELNMNWQSPQLAHFDIDFGFSCMGYEVAAGWGVKLAHPQHESIVLVGDGSYLMQNVDLYSSALSGHKIICVVCDNGGFAVIDKLQRNVGQASFNNLLQDCASTRPAGAAMPRVDFLQHARALGATASRVDTVTDLEQALISARQSPHSVVIVVDIDPTVWSSCDCWWDVGLPKVTRSAAQAQAVDAWNAGRVQQRLGL